MTLTPKTTPKPKVAVYKFSSCDGCQLQLLELEDELLQLAGEVEIASQHLAEAIQYRALDRALKKGYPYLILAAAVGKRASGVPSGP